MVINIGRKIVTQYSYNSKDDNNTSLRDVTRSSGALRKNSERALKNNKLFMKAVRDPWTLVPMHTAYSSYAADSIICGLLSENVSNDTSRSSL